MTLRSALLLCCALLGACSTMQPHRELIVYRGCDGRDHAVDVQVNVGLPALECIALAARNGDLYAVLEFLVAFPVLASVRAGPEDENRVRSAEMWVAPVNLDFVVTHEFDHVAGHDHPRALPLLQQPASCGDRGVITTGEGTIK